MNKDQRHFSLFTMIPRMLLFGFLISLVCSMTSQAADSEKNAKGTLTVAGKSSPLAYAYAVPEKDGEIRLILSDLPLSDKELKDVFERIERADSDKVHLLEVTLDKSHTATSISVRHKAIGTSWGGYSTDDIYQEKSATPQSLSGRVYRTKSGEFQGVSYTYDAEFSASLWHPPAPTLSGAAAKTSPQGKVALEFIKAARSGKIAEIRKLVTKEGQADLDGPQGKEIMGFMKLGPDPAKTTVKGVDVKGDQAEVELVESGKGTSSTTTLRLILEQGSWKIAVR